MIDFSNFYKTLITTEYSVVMQLEKLTALNKGWYDTYQGEPYDTIDIQWLISVFIDYDVLLPQPYAFPTLEGNVQFEWQICDYDITLTINLKTKKADYYAVNLKNDKEITDVLNLSKTKEWLKLNELIKNILHTGVYNVKGYFAKLGIDTTEQLSKDSIIVYATINNIKIYYEIFYTDNLKYTFTVLNIFNNKDHKISTSSDLNKDLIDVINNYLLLETLLLTQIELEKCIDSIHLCKLLFRIEDKLLINKSIFLWFFKLIMKRVNQRNLPYYSNINNELLVGELDLYTMYLSERFATNLEITEFLNQWINEFKDLPYLTLK